METQESIVARILRRDPVRAEATLQADIRSFILQAGLNVSSEQMLDVSMESQVGDGTRRRIDIEAGTTVIEVKKDLSRGTTRADAEVQLAGYLQRRSSEQGARYLGVLTDGHEWRLYVPDPDGDGVLPAGDPLVISSAADTERLRYWLGTVLATVEHVRPTAAAIVRELGADSPAHAADHATLHALFAAGSASSEVRLKRELWAKLLRTAFGSSFDDDQNLFVDHTLLVLIGEIIAHAVIGFDISPTGGLTARDLVSGAKFRDAQIDGVVESDFFDWPADVDGGVQFVRSLATRLSRFDWSRPDHDVLKHLYEAVISQSTRESLGEYYTPDWLAEAMIADVDTDPLGEVCADVACGSGTFVFHAVRTYLRAADEAGIANGQALEGLTTHVLGMDVHPVAVTLARVTYLLAIGSKRLTAADRGPLGVPVFLGDSVQWEDHQDLLAGDDTLTVSTSGDELVSGGGGTLFADDLVFPRSVTVEADRFDALLSDMADSAQDTSETLDRTLIGPILRRAKVTDAHARTVLTQTFATWRSLNRTGRDHIWGYYVRNLVRPLWLTQPGNRVDVLVGNPPWLRFNKMTSDMQARYRTLARGRNLLSGPLGASARDLSTLFVVRALELYAAPGARFAYVMPQGTLTRKPHDGFRSGDWDLPVGARFGQAWDLTGAAAATGFPMVACVIRGEVTSGPAERMPARVEAWTAHTSSSALSWSEIEPKLDRVPSRVSVLVPRGAQEVSPYKRKFRQGAIIVPRALLFVVEEDAGPLGAGAGRVRVRSRRSSTEKKPWKDVPDLTGTVERTFIHPVHLGETLLPYRMTEPLEAVLPISLQDPTTLASQEEINEYPGMSQWWATVEEHWEAHRVRTEKKPLRLRIDYSGQLSAQLPTDQAHRVLYSKSGNSLVASILSDPAALIDHTLYWAPVRSLAEGRYLVGILNSATLLGRASPLQSLGLFGARHFDKHIFDIAFPAFDGARRDHQDLVAAVEKAEQVAASVDIEASRGFQTARRLIRTSLVDDGVAVTIDDIVDRILPAQEPA